MNYEELEYTLKTFVNLKIDTIGRSWDDRNIYSISTFFNEKKDWIIIQGAIHAREHLSTDFIIFLAEIIDKNYLYFESLDDFPNICFVPMVNPDGVEIVYFGKDKIKNNILQKNISNIIKNNNYKLFKSNARGVDLNNNFDAKFELHEGACEPNFQGFRGEYAISEKETQALCDLTIKIKPIFTISYHLKGEEIYYDFYQQEEQLNRDRKIAELVAKANNYSIKSVQNISFGGYKDWCISKLNIPSLTIELGRDCVSHPIEHVEIYDIISKNAGILYTLCDIVKLCKS